MACSDTAPGRQDNECEQVLVKAREGPSWVASLSVFLVEGPSLVWAAQGWRGALSFPESEPKDLLAFVWPLPASLPSLSSTQTWREGTEVCLCFDRVRIHAKITCDNKRPSAFGPSHIGPPHPRVTCDGPQPFGNKTKEGK